jgi:endonuclease/exonuclease/phosphatase family metal-dependent hydrolase
VPPPGPFVLLQMNLCNSGMAVASCYTGGRAVDEAVQKIHRYAPDIVTLNEICRDDLYARNGWGKLARAMADVHGGGQISVSFVPVRNRYTDSPYQCVNDEQYGVGVIHHDGGRDAHHGWYRSQDGSDEIRAWTCITVVEGQLTGCTTHLSTTRAVAMRQCKELVSVLVSRWVMPEVVVAGDFNLTAAPNQEYDVRGCAPASYDIRGDGAVQHVFASRGIQWVEGRTEAMEWTDHPLLYEGFRFGQR